MLLSAVLRFVAYSLASLLVAAVFYARFLPPLRQLHFLGDIDGYHYPLLNYGLFALKEGRWPEWDPTIYCGLPFLANIQAALFYPPQWVLYALNWKRGAVNYSWLAGYLIFHYGLAFGLAWLWLRRHARPWIAALGALAFAFSGYFLNESQHLGVTCANAWLPLALWAMDGARANGRALWWVAVASALAITAGYPSAWLAWIFIVALYAAFQLPTRRWLAFAGAIALSLLLAAVQLWPAMELTAWRQSDPVFAPLDATASYLMPFLTPDWESHRQGFPVAHVERPYFYLGVIAFVGLGLALWRRQWRALRWVVPMLVVGAWVMFDPRYWLQAATRSWPVFPEVARTWNLAILAPVVAAWMAAAGLEAQVRQSQGRQPRWLTAILAAAALSLIAWTNSTQPTGFGSLAATLVLGVLCLTLLIRPTAFSAAALLVVTFADFQLHGTYRNFNSVEGNKAGAYRMDARAGRGEMLGLHQRIYEEMKAQPGYRVAIGPLGPHPTDLRHYRLSTPQGFDPFLPTQYRKQVERYAAWTTNRLFDFDLQRLESLRAFGVRWVMAQKDRLPAQVPGTHLIDTADSYYGLLELDEPLPAWRFPHAVRLLRWSAEVREFEVTGSGGFVLLEQRFPGWTATLEGAPLAVAPYEDAFQQVQIPDGGPRRLTFRYRSTRFREGAWASGAGVLLLAAWAVASRRGRLLNSGA
jgi:hypothetical protein